MSWFDMWFVEYSVNCVFEFEFSTFNGATHNGERCLASNRALAAAALGATDRPLPVAQR